jgi:hypothetical protein
MKKRMSVGTFVVVALPAAAGVGYRERCTLISWYQAVSGKVVARVTGAKSTSGVKNLYYCPMHPSFTSDRPGSCAICGMSLVKKAAAAVPTGQQMPGSGARKISYYRNPMNPQVTSPVPMKDEMGMDYVPVYEDQATQAHAGVYISPEKQQLIGVRKGRVEMRRLSGQIRTVGRVAYDLGEKLAVPEDAVMHAGTRDVVYVVDPDGYFTPRTVVLGTKAQGYYEVLQGLAANEEVVTSGNFLVDSESKLNAVLNQMGEPNQAEDGQQHD